MPSTADLDHKALPRLLDRERIPNIDVGPLFCGDEATRASLVEQIKTACVETGFFYIHNTCVEDEAIEETLAAMEVFFDLPDDSPIKQKIHNRRVNGHRGWTPIFEEPAYQQEALAHVESFDIGQELTKDACERLGVESNIWPDIPGFRETVLNYNARVTRLGRAISEVISEVLGLERNFISMHSGVRAPRTMRLLHYPANDGPIDDRIVGIAAHTDFECFTIMYQTSPGLELTDVNGEWCEAPSDIGTFTIILGDMTERFSNGWLKATGHRVVNTPWTRYSIILFFALNGEYTIAPLPHFVSRERPPRYHAITQDEHIRRELKRAKANLEASRRPRSP
jgi:isopenicillin N synthase-like dioxygenase